MNSWDATHSTLVESQAVTGDVSYSEIGTHQLLPLPGGVLLLWHDYASGSGPAVGKMFAKVFTPTQVGDTVTVFDDTSNPHYSDHGPYDGTGFARVDPTTYLSIFSISDVASETDAYLVAVAVRVAGMAVEVVDTWQEQLPAGFYGDAGSSAALPDGRLLWMGERLRSPGSEPAYYRFFSLVGDEIVVTDRTEIDFNPHSGVWSDGEVGVAFAYDGPYGHPFTVSGDTLTFATPVDLAGFGLSGGAENRFPSGPGPRQFVGGFWDHITGYPRLCVFSTDGSDLTLVAMNESVVDNNGLTDGDLQNRPRGVLPSGQIVSVENPPEGIYVSVSEVQGADLVEVEHLPFPTAAPFDRFAVNLGIEGTAGDRMVAVSGDGRYWVSYCASIDDDYIQQGIGLSWFGLVPVILGDQRGNRVRYYRRRMVRFPF